MRNFALLYTMVDMEKNAAQRPAHIAFLKGLQAENKIRTAWKFPDYQPGLLHSVMICNADSREDVLAWFSQDPVVQAGARTIEVRDAEQGIFGDRS
ncbi:YciI family protein [Pigmentiphaga daeguensis]|uniref:YCII-related domain-containing protein n=1 Tax=Pigmentiphaga daeguensis TaxID=414049 RepID=A0ABN1CAP9_9BURK